MKTRIITGIVLVLVILPCVIIGQIPFQVLLALVAGAGIFEMLSICDRPKANIYLYPLVGIFVYYSLFLDQSLIVVCLMMV